MLKSRLTSAPIVVKLPVSRSGSFNSDERCLGNVWIRTMSTAESVC
jgi:hypothetical protein